MMSPDMSPFSDSAAGSHTDDQTKIEVDGRLCHGHGRCWTLAPQIYSADAHGFNAARGRIQEVPPGLEDQAQVGIDNCPEGAIRRVE
jgi:ferredoxin